MFDVFWDGLEDFAEVDEQEMYRGNMFGVYTPAISEKWFLGDAMDILICDCPTS
jgi:hypothetical protein